MENNAPPTPACSPTAVVKPNTNDVWLDGIPPERATMVRSHRLLRYLCNIHAGLISSRIRALSLQQPSRGRQLPSWDHAIHHGKGLFLCTGEQALSMRNTLPKPRRSAHDAQRSIKDVSTESIDNLLTVASQRNTSVVQHRVNGAQRWHWSWPHAVQVAARTDEYRASLVVLQRRRAMPK